MGFWSRRITNVAALMGGSGAQALLATETDGLSIDFTDASLLVRDTTTTSNEWNAANGDAQTFWRDRSFTSYASPSPKITRDSSGYYKYRPHNIRPMSEKFNVGAWNTSLNMAVTSTGHTAPDGTATATLFTASAGSAVHRLAEGASPSSLPADTSYTASIYAKAGSNNYLFVYIADGSGADHFAATFNLATGAYDSSGSTGSPANTSYAITDVGGGWYRISATMEMDTGANAGMGFGISGGASPTYSSGLPTFNAAGTETAYFWGAQMNAGPVTDYVPTRAHNIILNSAGLSFWTAVSVTVSDNATAAPDGTTTADKLVEGNVTADQAIYQQSLGVAGVTHTLSIYAKAAERSAVALRVYNAANDWETAVFDLSGGSNTQNNSGSSTTFASRTQAITAVGNGWYRCSLTATLPSAICFFVAHLSNSATPTLDASTGSVAYAGDNTKGAYFWGGSLELASSAGKYVATGAAAVYESRYELPREWDSAGACQGLLVEEARTNLLTYSTQFDNAAWTKGEATVSANAVAAPDGTTTADKLTENTVNDAHEAYRADVTLANVAHTWSVYAKPAGRTWLAINAYDGSGHNTYFNLSGAGAVGTSAAGNTGSITALANGWYRCVVTRTAAATAAGGGGFIIASADNTASYAGDGSSGVYLWGAQLEAGAFVTSPIYTGSASVTRAGDLGIRAATSIMAYSQSAVTLYAKGTPQFPDASSTTQSAIGVDDATLDERHLLYRASANPKSVTVDGGVTQADVDGGAWAVSTEGKIAASIAVNDVAISFSGGAAVTDTSATMPAVHTIGIGNSVSLAPFTGHIKQIMVLPRAMTDAELVYLTTYGVATDIGPVGSGLQLEDGSGSFLLVEDSSYLIQET
jgi:hypothetical protein